MSEPSVKVEKKLEAIFTGLFRGSSSDRLLTLRRGTAPWDSLKHIEVINTLEQEYQVRFSFSDAIAANSIEEIQTILNRLVAS